MVKKTLVFIILIQAFSTTYSQNNSIRIDVSNTHLPDTLIKEISFIDALEMKTSKKIESFDVSKINDSIVYSRMNSFIAALHFGFDNHRPVVISPDIIWLTILQGFAIHINQNSDSLRNNITKLPANKMIIVRDDTLIKGKIDNNWPASIFNLVDSVELNISKNIYDLYNVEYSTTDKNIRIAYKTTLLNSLDNYFDYGAQTACGIPYIILKGTSDDWLKMSNKLKLLNGYGINHWVDKLDFIVEKIYQSSIKNIDIKFWQNIYSYHQVSGGNRVTGWITDLFPYLYDFSEDGYSYRENSTLRINKDSLFAKYAGYTHKDRLYWQIGLTGGSFPNGISTVDIKWFYNPTPSINDTFEMVLFAGFIGIEQNKNTFELTPIISWGIYDKASNTVVNQNLKGFEAIVGQSINEVDNGNWDNCCDTRVYDTQGITETPRFNLNGKKSLNRAEFEDFLREKLEKKRSIYSDRNYEIIFHIDKKGKCSEIIIENCTDEVIIEKIKSILYKKGAWIPAKSYGLPVDFNMYIVI
ncbi:MAG: DUF4419 domain-containing protein [Saprospiraceae bacterium]|nr:DUF4419 domain-containing protein [Saprospiraceae bacterium]